MSSISVGCKVLNPFIFDSSDESYSFFIEENVLFYAPLDSFNEPEAFIGLLNDNEIERKQKFFFKRDENIFTISRAILKLFASKISGLAANQILISQKDDHSKPFFDNPALNLNFNIAHSDKYLLVGFSRNSPIGVDIERNKRNFHPELIVQNYFSKDENRMFAAAENKEEFFFKIWTRKEAFVKLIGGHLLDFLLQINVANDQQIIENLPFEVGFDYIEITNFSPEKGVICSYALPLKESKMKIFALNQKILKTWLT